MSDPWIKVYPADMRADPAIISMNPARRYALIQAWDLAKNGPGMIDELRSNDGSTMTERELRKLATVSQHETRQLFNDWAMRGLCTIEDGLVRFPSLAKRQGIDATAAERMRRHRERKRYGAVTPKSRQKLRPSLRDVTGENQNQIEIEPTPTPSSVTAPPKSREPDPIWDALILACPIAGEMPKSERGRRNNAVKQLREISADPGDVAVVARHLAQKWQGRIAVTPQAIVSHWSATLAEIHPNGHGPKRTAEDFERLGAERDDAERKARLADAIAAQPDLEDSPI